MYDEHIKSRLIKDIRFFRETKDQSDQKVGKGSGSYIHFTAAVTQTKHHGLFNYFTSFSLYSLLNPLYHLPYKHNEIKSALNTDIDIKST